MAAYLLSVCVLYFLCLLQTVSAHRVAFMLWSILGSVLPILICVSLLICFLAPCCLFHKLCRKRHRNVVNTVMVVHSPQHPPAFPGQPQYHAVPGHPQGYGLQPLPSAPPQAYVDYGGPGHASPPMVYNGAAFVQGPPEGYPEPTHRDGDAPPPYNPSY